MAVGAIRLMGMMFVGAGPSRPGRLSWAAKEFTVPESGRGIRSRGTNGTMMVTTKLRLTFSQEKLFKHAQWHPFVNRKEFALCSFGDGMSWKR
jgi:hypothetical protein